MAVNHAADALHAHFASFSVVAAVVSESDRIMPPRSLPHEASNMNISAVDTSPKPTVVVCDGMDMSCGAIARFTGIAFSTMC